MAKRHVHKYHRVDMGYAMVWACALPDCNHHMPKHMDETLEGKYSFCWACDAKFTLDREAMKDDKPKCFNCRTGTIVTAVEEPMSDVLAELLKKLEV